MGRNASFLSLLGRPMLLNRAFRSLVKASSHATHATVPIRGCESGRKLSTKGRGVKRWQPIHPQRIKVIPWGEAMCPWGEVMRLQVIP